MSTFFYVKIGMKGSGNMERPKGGVNRKWSKEEKLRIVNRYNEEKIGLPTLAREENISKGMLHSWIERYQEEGEAGMDPNNKKGNIFAALHTSKSLTETERLKLLVAKQQVEIERLKKGYRVKGGGNVKEYVTTKGVNLKSSTK